MLMYLKFAVVQYLEKSDKIIIGKVCGEVLLHHNGNNDARERGRMLL